MAEDPGLASSYDKTDPRAAQKLLDMLEAHGIRPPVSPSITTRRIAEYAGTYPLPNHAVEVCSASWTRTDKEQEEKKAPTEDRYEIAKLAYCAALPKLSSRPEITDFIACIAHAMAMGILPGAEGTRLIYAAQVAHSTLPSPKSRTKRRKTSQKQPSMLPPIPTPAMT